MKSKAVRVYDLARRLAIPSREILDMLKTHGIEIASHMNTIEESVVDLILKTYGPKKSEEPPKTERPKPERKPVVHTFVPPPQQPLRRPFVPRSGDRSRWQQDQQPSSQPPREPYRGDQARGQQPQAREPYRGDQARGQQPQAREPYRGDQARGQQPRGEQSRGQQPRGEQARGQQPRGEQSRGQQPSRPFQQPRPWAPPKTDGSTSPEVTEKAQQREKRERRFQHRGTEQKKVPEKDHDRGGVRKKPIVPREEAEIKGEARKQEWVVLAQEEGVGLRKEALPAQKSIPTPVARPDEEPQGLLIRRPAAKKPRHHVSKELEVKTAKPAIVVPVEQPKVVRMQESIMVKDLAEQMSIPPAKIVIHLMSKGVMANVNQVLELEAAKDIAKIFGFDVQEISLEEALLPKQQTVDASQLKPRPPVVTIMGHVDHGKTTLLDAIRESSIVDTEFGGITQHIGAYTVDVNGQKVVFLDTPGHEAFTAMRARGVQVTDEVILVVAADDGIMPQTIEAIDHARAAKVPIVVAINKIDLPGANPDRVMQELTKHGLTPEDWGGETICVKVSAKKRTNLEDLLEMIVLQSEILELKANPDCPAEGIVVEAMLDKGRGPVATVLVRQGTLRVGDSFVAGLHHGKVRAMFDDLGRKVIAAGPSIPVEVLGMTGVPVAGDTFTVVENDRIARQIAESRQEQQQRTEALKTGKITLGELHQHIKEGGFQELRIVIKADVHGSVEALGDALERLGTDQVRLQVIHGGVGAINESDVMLAAASNAIVLGFNVRPVTKARELAEKEQIELRQYTIIYQAIDDIKKAMEGLLEPTYKEALMGQAVVQATFTVPKIGTVAGCRVTSGKFLRNAIVKLFRDHKEIYKGTIASLRREKDDVREVLNGYECGIKLENYNDVKVNDLIEAYTLEKIAVTLESTMTKQN